MTATQSSVDLATTTVRRAMLMRSVLGSALAAISALLLWLAFPPYGLWPLIWVGFVPMLVAQHRVLPARYSSLAPAITLGCFFGALFAPVFSALPEITGVMRWLPLAIGALTFVSYRRYRTFHTHTGYRWLPLQSTVNWVATMLICSLVPVAGTWPMLANALYSQPWLLQPISITGIFGLEALILFVNATLGLAAIQAFDQRWTLDDGQAVINPHVTRRWVIGTGSAVVIWIGVSLALLRTPVGPTVRVAAIQPNREALLTSADHAQPSSVWWDRINIAIWPQLVAQTRDAAHQGAQLIVWPEAALSDDPRTTRRDELRALAAETHAYLAISYTVDRPDGHSNEVTVISPDGTFLGVYGKDHPLTFAGETSVSHHGHPTYATEFGKLATIICYDLDFLDTARATAANGAQIVAVPTGDWAAIARLHYTHVIFRAIEHRMAMVVAEWSFDSAIIDPRGQVVASRIAPNGAQATLVADVPIGTADAPATKIGDVLGWIALAGLIVFAVVIPLNARRAARTTTAWNARSTDRVG